MGVAQQLYHQYRGSSKKEDPIFDSVDIECAKQCLPSGTEQERRLIATLSQAVRQGHLCLTVNSSVTPATATLIGVNIDDELIEAAKSFPPCPYLHREGDRFYFQKFWLSEERFRMHLQRMIKSSPEIALDEKRVLTILKECDNLLPEQIHAIRLACRQSLSVITGGPGTGKTFTAGVLIETLWKAMTPEHRETCRFVLTAPTGKAGIHLQRSFARVCQHLPGFPPLQAQTLHGLLGIRSGNRKTIRLLADVILVDESSMIDVQLMSQLMASVKSGARIIFLGDSHQLPPVEAGSLFTDMIGQLDEVGLLTQCLRSELEGIRQLSDAIYSGSVQDMFRILNGGENGVKRLAFSEGGLKALVQSIVSYAVKRQPALPDFSYGAIKQYLESFCLLSPLRKGFLGVDHLNEQISQQLKESLVRPILITRNDPRKGLFNGDTGLLVNGEYALFPDSDESLKKIPALLLPPYDYAYCLSVHKSQGSEFHHVALLMPPGAESFGAELFYTGVTRAKKRIEIWGSDDVLSAAVQKKTIRHSGFKPLTRALISSDRFL